MESNLGKWDGWYVKLSPGSPGAFKYGDTVTYRIGAEFLSDCETVEDWGCGAGGFRRFRPNGYRGIDGSKTPYADTITDLRTYRSDVDGIMMRHVIEHDYGWADILAGAVASCRKKLCLVIFTPIVERTFEIAHNRNFTDTHENGVDVPNLAFASADIERFFAGHEFVVNDYETDTGYKKERVYLVTKNGKS